MGRIIDALMLNLALKWKATQLIAQLHSRVLLGSSSESIQLQSSKSLIATDLDGKFELPLALPYYFYHYWYYYHYQPLLQKCPGDVIQSYAIHQHTQATASTIAY